MHRVSIVGASLTALFGAILYAQTLAHPFFYDDVFYVVKNPAIREFVDLPRAFTQPFSPVAPGLYRPMTTLSYAFDYAIAGLSHAWFHFSNVFLHALASGVFFFAAFYLLKSLFPALVAGALFAVHPVHTEAVTWVAGRNELLAALFVFLSVLTFLHARGQEGKRQVVLLTTSALLWLLALLSKEIALPLPLILLAISFLPSRGYNFQSAFAPVGASADEEPGGSSAVREGEGLIPRSLLRLRESRACSGVHTSDYVNILKVKFGRFLSPFVLVFVLYLLLRVNALGELSVPVALTRTADLTFLERMVLMAPVITHYMRLMVVPVGLRLEYDWVSFPFWITLASVLLILSTVALGVWLWKRGWRAVAFGILWFFLFLIPVSNIIPIGELVAERFLYLPSAGFCLFVGALVAQCNVERWKRLLLLFILCILFLFSFLTIQRNSEWRDPEALWRSTLELSPSAPHAAENLAALLLAKGDLGGAGELLQRMLGRFSEKPMTNYLVAQWHLRRGEREEAVPFLERALKVAGPTNIEFTDFQRGAVFLELERFEEALESLERAYQANPYDPALLNNVGVAQASLGNTEGARASFTRAISLFEEQGSLSEEERRNYKGAKVNLEMLH